MDHLKQLGITVAGVLIALTIGWTGYTMYQDHIFIEAVRNAAQQMQTRQQMPKPEIPSAKPTEPKK